MNAAASRIIFACLLVFSFQSTDCSAQLFVDTLADALTPSKVSLGSPPEGKAEERLKPLATKLQNKVARQQEFTTNATALEVLPGVRSSVVAFFKNVYLPVFSVPMNWTGNAQSCAAGTTSQAYIDATFDLINYYRAMVKLAPVTNDVSKNAATQEAALMMSVNNSLSHFPPTSWTCYTAEGATAAGKSNIALGATGPRAVALYIKDPGTYNNDIGHRRWLLHPPRATFGIGSVGGATRDANAIWVFAATTTRPSTDIVAWPPRGFVPLQLVYPRWSFSLNNVPGADYSSASISMFEDGVPVSLKIVSSDRVGYGDNTLVWEPSGLVFSRGQADREFDIVVSNVGNAAVTTYSYRVTVIDTAIDPPGVFSDGFE